jgi:hypothetical protein
MIVSFLSGGKENGKYIEKDYSDIISRDKRTHHEPSEIINRIRKKLEA